MEVGGAGGHSSHSTPSAIPGPVEVADGGHSIMDQTDISLQLMAYADGELSSDDVTRIEAYIAVNPDAQAIVDAHRRLRSVISGKTASEKAPAYRSGEHRQHR